MQKKLFLGLLILILIDIAFAASIHGTVYDLYLDKQADAIVTVNSTPQQTYVAKNGNYSFELGAGSYEIKAEYCRFGELISSAEENITITNEGDFVVDLILFPSFGEEEEILNAADFEVNEVIEEGSIWEKIFFAGFVGLLIKVIITLIAVVVIIIVARKIYKKIKEEEEAIEKEDEKDMIKEITSFIKSKGGRATQKDIRKKFMSSQATISLVLTEMEDKGIVQKIKKGRGNVIILKKK